MQNIFFYRPTYPISFRTVTGNKQFLFLGLSLFIAGECKRSESHGKNLYSQNFLLEGFSFLFW